MISSDDCPRCGTIRQEIGNGMIGKCEKCGFIQCPSCGQEAIEKFCVDCMIHIDEKRDGIHSVGMCPDCNLEIFEKIRNTNQYERRKRETNI